jgi:hypothetical protein
VSGKESNGGSFFFNTQVLTAYCSPLTAHRLLLTLLPHTSQLITRHPLLVTNIHFFATQHPFSSSIQIGHSGILPGF